MRTEFDLLTADKTDLVCDAAVAAAAAAGGEGTATTVEGNVVATTAGKSER